MVQWIYFNTEHYPKCPCGLAWGLVLAQECRKCALKHVCDTQWRGEAGARSCSNSAFWGGRRAGWGVGGGAGTVQSSFSLLWATNFSGADPCRPTGAPDVLPRVRGNVSLCPGLEQQQQPHTCARFSNGRMAFLFQCKLGLHWQSIEKINLASYSISKNLTKILQAFPTPRSSVT